MEAHREENWLFGEYQKLCVWVRIGSKRDILKEIWKVVWIDHILVLAFWLYNCFHYRRIKEGERPKGRKIVRLSKVIVKEKHRAR